MSDDGSVEGSLAPTMNLDWGDDPDEEEMDPLVAAVDQHIARFVEARRDADSALAADELVKLAVLFEGEEAAFRQNHSDLFSREREGHRMWAMLAAAADHSTFLQNVFSLLTDRADAVLQAAAARALSAAAPGLACYPTLQQSMFMEMLTADAMEDSLFGWVEAPALPMCSHASRLLAFALLDDRCADEAVRMGLVPKLLRRLRGIVFEDSSVVGAPGAKGGEQGNDELSGRELLARERGCIVQCCCVLMSYKETLACALQEGALDIILALIRPEACGPTECHDALRMLGALLSHRKFCLVFLDAGGVAKLLLVEQTHYCASSIALCLLSMACFRGVMDKVCRLAEPDPHALTAFALRLLDLDDDTASCNILQFLAKVLSYKVFLRAFDGLKGAQQLNKSARRMLDAAVEGRSLAKNVLKYNSCALRNYLRSHLLFAHQQIVAASSTHDGAHDASAKPQPNLASWSVDCEAEDQVADACMCVERQGRFHELATWMDALQQAASHDGIRSLTELLTISSSLRMPDMAVFSLNALQVVCLLPVVRVEFAEQLLEDEAAQRTGMRVLVDAAGGSVFADGHVICAALRVLCTCIGCSAPPMTLRAVQRGGGAREVHGGTPARGHQHQHAQEDKAAWASLVWESSPPSASCRRIWALLQECDGIKVLSSLTKKSEHSCADAIRALACRSLLGLSHDGRILQILQETQLALALAELVKKEQRVRAAVRDVQAAAFRLVATRLISRVTGRAQHAVLGVAGDSALRMMEKAAAVEQAAIAYDRKELLRLVHGHLASLGLERSAAALQAEADLEEAPQAPQPHPAHVPHTFHAPPTPQTPHTPSRPTPGRPVGLSLPQSASPQRVPALRTPQGGAGASAAKTTGEAGSSKAPLHAANHHHSGQHQHPPNVRVEAGHGGSSREAMAAGREAATPGAGAGRDAAALGEGTPGGGGGLHQGVRHPDKATNSLDNIVKTYLRKLHSECRNPIRVLPPLSLANAHKGPWYQGPGIGAPMHSTDASTNVTCRVLGRECGWGGFRESRHGGRGGGGLMRQFVYSRFKPYPWRFTDSPDASTSNAGLTTGAFLRTQEGRNAWLLGGTKKGTLCRFNFDMPMPVWEVQVHEEAVTRVQVGGSAVAAGTRILSSSEKEARVWEVDEQEGSIGDAPMLSIPECANASFNHGCDRIVGIAPRGRTLVVDAETGGAICTLQEAGHSGAGGGAASVRAMRHRRACFSPDDQMILSDGVLWDPRVTSSYVHKFDRFASYGGGSFHPSRPEVIISAAVWDIRTNFKLLRWCPPLDQMHTVFSPSGQVMYGFLKYFEEEGGAGASHRTHVRKYKHMFRTVDAVTYTDIATVELKDNVADLIVDTRDDVIALMESAKDPFAGYSGTTCRLYEVGRQKASRSDDEDEEEDEEANADSEDEDEEDGGSDALGGLFNGGGNQAALLGDLLGSDMSGLDDDEGDDEEEGDDDDDDDDGIDDMDEDEFEEMMNEG